MQVLLTLLQVPTIFESMVYTRGPMTYATITRYFAVKVDTISFGRMAREPQRRGWLVGAMEIARTPGYSVLRDSVPPALTRLAV